jgi:hypothetical protein
VIQFIDVPNMDGVPRGKDIVSYQPACGIHENDAVLHPTSVLDTTARLYKFTDHSKRPLEATLEVANTLGPALIAN